MRYRHTLFASDDQTGHAQEVTPRRELPDAAIGREAVDQIFEMAERDELQQLREYGSASIHRTAPSAEQSDIDTVQKHGAILNRQNARTHRSSRQYWVTEK